MGTISQVNDALLNFERVINPLISTSQKTTDETIALARIKDLLTISIFRQIADSCWSPSPLLDDSTILRQRRSVLSDLQKQLTLLGVECETVNPLKKGEIKQEIARLQAFLLSMLCTNTPLRGKKDKVLVELMINHFISLVNKIKDFLPAPQAIPVNAFGNRINGSISK